ncbi:hypothetical protein ITJ57_09825 [Plantibacter sp. VKM Ac-2880]|uniref:hypothetical protein n=1 Tax=Plantibacter sp. VKM Ac-2880 TaxID=2783827 RepID=UPI00188F3951|nr:hypothetical protein [Plantibacter sp. VKM Ac-2880]MBF4569062.1 hypothetical protein [Plantibacter sp. VKM Ac-2880]
MKRRRLGVVLSAATLLLAGCAHAPDPDPGWRAQADAARDAALGALSDYELTGDTGYEVMGDRLLDRCGTLTSDQGGFRDRHVEGHACTAVRTVVLTVPKRADEDDTAEHLLQMLDAAGLHDDVDDADRPGTYIEHYFYAGHGHQVHVRGIVETDAEEQRIDLFDDEYPWLYRPVVISETGGWLDGSPVRGTAIIIAISITYFDNVGV